MDRARRNSYPGVVTSLDPAARILIARAQASALGVSRRLILVNSDSASDESPSPPTGSVDLFDSPDDGDAGGDADADDAVRSSSAIRAASSSLSSFACGGTEEGLPPPATSSSSSSSATSSRRRPTHVTSGNQLDLNTTVVPSS